MKKINEAAFLKPWAMKEDVIIAMKEIVERHLRGEKLTDTEIAAKTSGKKEAPDFEIVNGVARIPIYGVISKRMSMFHRISSSGTSTLEIKDMIQAAMGDDKVESLLLDIDSPGGSSDGVLELSDYIFSLRGQKKIFAFANGEMCSAAYWIGSSADKIFASRGAAVGSIGVYAVVDDWTVANHNAGLKTEVIKAGKNKAAGHPDKPFTQDDRDVIQKEVNKVYELFIESVSRNRGISIEDVLKIATGDIFIGQDAFDNGLVDGIETFDALFINAAVNGGPAQSKTRAAADSKIDESAKKQTTEEVDMVDVKDLTAEKLKAENKAVAETLIAEGKAAGIAEGKQAGIEEGKKLGVEEGKIAGAKEARQIESERVSKIVESMVPGMEKLAIAAIKEGKSVEQAKDAYLQETKKAAPPSPGANADPALTAEAAQATLSLEDQCIKDWESNPKLHDDWASLDAYTGYTRGVKKGRIREVKK